MQSEWAWLHVLCVEEEFAGRLVHVDPNDDPVDKVTEVYFEVCLGDGERAEDIASAHVSYDTDVDLGSQREDSLGA